MDLFEVNHLSVSRGGEAIVEDVSFTVERGHVLGLIGPNGAGKSTTLGGILGLYPIISGSITLDGHTFDKQAPLTTDIKGQLAYIPEQPAYYEDLTLMEHLHWKQRLWRRYKDSDIEARMNDLITKFDLMPHLHKFPHECSKGTMQKLMVISAFMIPFQLLVVDEPFVGLDIVSIRHLKNLIEEASYQGSGIIISTHVLDAAEKMCSHFVLLSKGRTLERGSLAELREQASKYTGQMDSTLEDLFVGLVQQQYAPNQIGRTSE